MLGSNGSGTGIVGECWGVSDRNDTGSDRECWRVSDETDQGVTGALGSE